jgi:xanthine dehydrogenase accessory factor
MENIYLKLLEVQSGSNPVLATVTGAIGSTPQKPGSSALIDQNGLVCGTVGGGVTEGQVVEYATECSSSGLSAHMHFFLNNDVSEKGEAICGGEISVLIDAKPLNHQNVFRELKESLEKREPGILVTMVTSLSDTTVLINRYWFTRNSIPSLPLYFLNKIQPLADNMLGSADPAGFKQLRLSIPGEEPESLFLLEAVLPLPRLLIAGAGHIGRALSHIGKLLDFNVTVIDDREVYANKTNLPDADHVVVSEIGKAISESNIGPDTYIVIVTRGHSDDANALRQCIGSNAAYVGMIGSRPKVAKIYKDFISNGWATEEEWSKIHSPVGLEINSKTVQEIAVSIAAQLVQVRNGKK